MELFLVENSLLDCIIFLYKMFDFMLIINVIWIHRSTLKNHNLNFLFFTF